MSANSKAFFERECAEAPFPTSDRRASPRVRTVYFTVKVDKGGNACLLCARNISDTGMMLDAHVRLDVDEPVTITLSEGVDIPGVVQWHDGDRCGVRFVRPVDSTALLHAEAERKRMDRRGGSLRVAAKVRGTSFSEMGIRAVTVSDVSHRGMGLTHDGTLGAGMSLDVVLDTGIQRRGEVRWSEAGRAGIYLLEPLNFRELAKIGGLDPLSSISEPSILRDSV